jgi:hypothetical protein
MCRRARKKQGRVKSQRVQAGCYDVRGLIIGAHSRLCSLQRTTVLLACACRYESYLVIIVHATLQTTLQFTASDGRITNSTRRGRDDIVAYEALTIDYAVVSTGQKDIAAETFECHCGDDNSVDAGTPTTHCRGVITALDYQKVGYRPSFLQRDRAPNKQPQCKVAADFCPPRQQECTRCEPISGLCEGLYGSVTARSSTSALTSGPVKPPRTINFHTRCPTKPPRKVHRQPNTLPLVVDAAYLFVTIAAAVSYTLPEANVCTNLRATRDGIASNWSRCVRCRRC